ncbi:MAG: hypothetical protein F6K41_39105 [Symploca sp. SIO3E6]|nr:hypothetical protein [Caldora sp. SIO3E6]
MNVKSIKQLALQSSLLEHLSYSQRVLEFSNRLDSISTLNELLAYTKEFMFTERDYYQSIGAQQVENFIRDLEELFLCFYQNDFNSIPLKSLIIILLKQQVEICWYDGFDRYLNSDQIDCDRQLYDLTSRPPRYHLNFSFTVLQEAGIHRFLNSLKRRLRLLLNHPAGGTVGMKTVRCKLAIIALLNQLSDDVGKLCRRSVSLQVNSIIRTVEHQQHLAGLGYWAPQTTSHSTGYAVDIEQAWYAKNDRQLFEGIQLVLEDYARRLHLNVIDEERIWHICLNPQLIEFYENRLSLWTI